MIPSARDGADSGSIVSTRPIRYGCMIVAAVLIMIALYCRVRLLPLPLERDEGGFAYMAQQLLQGKPLFESGNTKLLGGVYFAYALSMALFGESVRGIHLGLLVVNMTSALLVYMLARRFLSREAAILSTGVYVYLSASKAVLGVVAHATHFVMFFVLAGLVMLYRGLDTGRKSLLFASGVAFGCAVLMKQHGIFFCPLAFCVLAEKRHATGEGIKTILGDFALLAVGMLLPYLATCVYMFVNGVFGEFWFWTVTYSFAYATEGIFSHGFSTLMQRITPQYLYLRYAWLLGVIGLLTTFHPRSPLRERWFLPAFFVCAILAVMPGYLFYWHYFVMVIPPLALLIGGAYDNLSRFGAAFGNTMLARMVPLMVVALVCADCVYRERQYLFHLAPKEVSRTVYDSDLFAVSDEIARYIGEHSDSTAQLAIIGSEPQICFYARRTSASNYLYMYGLDTPHQFQARMQEEMIGEIERARPEYLIYVGTYDSWFANQGGDRITNWVNNYLASYRQVGFVDIGVGRPSTCTWGELAEHCEPAFSQYVSVFRRVL